LADHHHGSESPEFRDIGKSREKALMPDCSNNPAVLCMVEIGRLLATHPDSQKGKVKAQEIIAKGYQAIPDKIIR
jgi:hypothetical protein